MNTAESSWNYKSKTRLTKRFYKIGRRVKNSLDAVKYIRQQREKLIDKLSKMTKLKLSNILG